MKTESKEVSETPSAPSDKVPPADTGRIGTDYWKNDDWQATVIGKTPDGKSVQVVKRQEGMGYEVNFREGGNKPADFDGWFTSYDKAEAQARLYLTKLLEK